MPSANGLPTTLENIGILEFLEQDPRPSFVLELKKTLDFGSGLLHPVVYNAALLEHGPLLGAVVGTASGLANHHPESHADFVTWASNPNVADHSPRNSRTTFVYRDYFWTRIIIQKWMVISGFSLNRITLPLDANDDLTTPLPKRLKVNTIADGDISSELPPGEWAFDPGQATLHRKFSEEDASTDSRNHSFELIAPIDVPFKRLIKVNPAGIFFISPDGGVLWANDAWYTITDHPRNLSQMSFMDCLAEEDLPLMQTKWHELLAAKKTVRFDIQLRKKWFHEPTKTWKLVWVNAEAAPELNFDGSLESVMGCIRDISRTKQAQDDQIEYTNVSAQLAQKTKQCLESEAKFTQMVNTAPYGIFCADPQGAALWANHKCRRCPFLSMILGADIQSRLRNDQTTDRYEEALSKVELPSCCI